MEAKFWHQKWETNEIGFHQNQANPLLVEHFEKLALPTGSRVFLPLCGKTLDIQWLLSKGYRVAGAELSCVAIAQLFEQLGIEPALSSAGLLQHYHIPNLDLYVGDIFHLSAECLGPVDAVYDRAALVALPKEMRKQYAAHLLRITNQAPQLLLCFLYDQALLDGPPFSVSDEEVHQHYGESHELKLIASNEVSGGLKGQVAAQEHVWLLQKHSSKGILPLRHDQGFKVDGD